MAEDNPIVADMLRFNLEHAGFSVTVAVDGRQATDHLESEQFDAIITDYQMPHVDGEELCRNARQNERHKDVPIFLYSAKGIELDTERLTEELGIAAIFFQPFSPREVVQAVRAAIQERRLSV
jgi:CheY-like chemotaxis protein